MPRSPLSTAQLVQAPPSYCLCAVHDNEFRLYFQSEHNAHYPHSSRLEDKQEKTKRRQSKRKHKSPTLCNELGAILSASMYCSYIKSDFGTCAPCPVRPVNFCSQTCSHPPLSAGTAYTQFDEQPIVGGETSKRCNNNSCNVLNACLAVSYFVDLCAV